MTVYVLFLKEKKAFVSIVGGVESNMVLPNGGFLRQNIFISVNIFS